MITRLHGTILDCSENALTLMVQGVGYGLQVPQAQKFSVGQEIDLHTSLQWNQESGPSIFGFATILERDLFQVIISCSGIGPKIGLALLAHMTPSQFIDVVQRGDEDALSAINGIGPKKAEQLLMHLKHKVAKMIDKGLEIPDSPAFSSRQNIAQVLKSLNYSKPEITAALNHINENYAEPAIPFDQLMRHALGYLAKRL
jgi:Holliday junction DNA helicase RuvA